MAGGDMYPISCCGNAKPPEAARPLQVPAHFGDMSHAIEELEKVAADLLGRLAPVRTPGPCDPSCNEAAVPQVCGLADTIRSLTTRISAVRANLSEALSELEI